MGTDHEVVGDGRLGKNATQAVASGGPSINELQNWYHFDTHGLLRPEAERCMEGVDHIIHGGDIGDPGIIQTLRRIAPVTAIRGNVDNEDWALEYPETETVRLADRSIFVLHDLKTLQIDPSALGIDVVVSGHSHIPKVEKTAGGVLYLNPGSAGRRRFKLPITLATLDITPDGLRPIIHDLGIR